MLLLSPKLSAYSLLACVFTSVQLSEKLRLCRRTFVTSASTPMSQPTNRTTVFTASRQEALALANAARNLTNLLPAVEDSSEVPATALQQSRLMA